MRIISVGGLQVSRIGSGATGMSAYGAGAGREGDAALRSIHRTIELAATRVDPADARGTRADEKLVGRVVAGHRDRVVLATTFGRGSSPGARSGMDLVDADPRVEEGVRAPVGTAAAARVGHIGVSAAGPGSVRRDQAEYSLWTRELGSYLLPLLRDLGVELVAYSPLGHRFLTGTRRSLEGLDPDDWRHTNPRFTSKNLRSSLRVVEEVEAVATEVGASPAQIALSWLLVQDDTAPRTAQVARFREKPAGDDLELTPDQVARLGALPAACGERHHAAAMAAIS